MQGRVVILFTSSKHHSRDDTSSEKEHYKEWRSNLGLDPSPAYRLHTTKYISHRVTREMHTFKMDISRRYKKLVT